jgi:peptide deformylase
MATTQYRNGKRVVIPPEVVILDHQHMTIITFPDDILRRACNPVVEGQFEIEDTVRHLVARLQGSSGIGLAANQIGFLHRIFVMNPEKDGNVVVIANPVMVQGYDLKEKMEGCLSFPGIYDRVPRFDKIDVRFDVIDPKTLHFTPAADTLKGINAQVFQHETEHLSGVLMIDHLMPNIQKRVQLKMGKRKSRGW